jgi:hypothetical protein
MAGCGHFNRSFSSLMGFYLGPVNDWAIWRRFQLAGGDLGGDRELFNSLSLWRSFKHVRGRVVLEFSEELSPARELNLSVLFSMISPVFRFIRTGTDSPQSIFNLVSSRSVCLSKIRVIFLIAISIVSGQTRVRSSNNFPLYI